MISCPSWWPKTSSLSEKSGTTLNNIFKQIKLIWPTSQNATPLHSSTSTRLSQRKVTQLNHLPFWPTPHDCWDLVSGHPSTCTLSGSSKIASPDYPPSEHFEEYYEKIFDYKTRARAHLSLAWVVVPYVLYRGVVPWRRELYSSDHKSDCFDTWIS